MGSASYVLLFGSIIIFTSVIISAKVSTKIGVPILLLFLVAGMFFGCDGFGIEFSDMRVAQTIGMFALSIILFTGGLSTSKTEIKPVLKQGAVLSSIGVILTTLITGTFIWLLMSPLHLFTGQFKVTYPMCLLLAAVMSSTDSASVFNILQGVGLRKHLRPLLELESGSNDPVANILTIVLIQICQGGEDFSAWNVAVTFFLQVAVGILCGVLFGKGFVWVFNKIKLNNTSLYPILMLCIIFFSFSITDLFKGNGYLAVYLTGIIMGNRPLVKKKECAKFLDGITWLCQIIMFLALGLLVTPHELISTTAILGTIIGVFMIFIGRPLAVFISLLPFKKPNFKARLYASWVGLRGATPIIFATYPVVAGIPGSQNIFNLVFFITILSLILQGTTVIWMAKKLDMVRVLPRTGNIFGVELPEEIDSKLWDLKVTDEMLKVGNQLKDMSIPQGVLVIMIKRGDDYLVPNGTLEMKKDDLLLLIGQKDTDQELVLQA